MANSVVAVVPSNAWHLQLVRSDTLYLIPDEDLKPYLATPKDSNKLGSQSPMRWLGWEPYDIEATKTALEDQKSHLAEQARQHMLGQINGTSAVKKLSKDEVGIFVKQIMKDAHKTYTDFSSIIEIPSHYLIEGIDRHLPSFRKKLPESKMKDPDEENVNSYIICAFQEYMTKVKPMWRKVWLTDVRS